MKEGVYVVLRFMLLGMPRKFAEQAMARRSRRPAMSHDSNLLARDC